LTSHLWVPGSAEPSLEAFVERVHRQIERYTASHSAEQSNVEVELAEGERLTLQSLSSEPGFGFLTLSVRREDEDPEELIVPIGAIKRIALRPADETRRPGFALPGRK
jgi:hypothetical protein